MLVREVMSKNVKPIGPDSTVRDAAKEMREGDFGAMPVYDGKKLMGMITDRDIAVRIVAEGKDSSNAKVREAMTNEVLTVYDDDDINKATKVMSDRQVRRVPVIDHNQKLVGMISISDMARINQASDNAGIAMTGVSETRHDEPGRTQRH